MSTTSNFWPLDYDPEGEIYENVSWDLPGFRRNANKNLKPKRRAGHRTRH